MNTGKQVLCAGMNELGIHSMSVCVPDGQYLIGEARMSDGSRIITRQYQRPPENSYRSVLNEYKNEELALQDVISALESLDTIAAEMVLELCVKAARRPILGGD